MKKLLLTAILLVLPTVAVAQPLGTAFSAVQSSLSTTFNTLAKTLKKYVEDNYHYFADKTPVLMSINGKTYFIEDLDKLEKDLDELKDSDPCISKLFESIKDKELVEALLGSCKTNMWKHEDRVRDLGGDEKGSGKLDFVLRSNKGALAECLVDISNLKTAMEDQRKNMTEIKNHVNLEECVNNLAYTKSCPIGANTTGAHNVNLELLKAFNWNQFTKEKYAFPVPGNYKPGKALIFDGSVLIACQKENDGSTSPKYVVHTAYSGLKGGCQNAQYSGVPRAGPIPNGVYLLGKVERIDNAGSKSSWGDYRYPLIPAMTTNTYFRDSMYLHGTSDKTKQQSAGCISLGTYIDEFVRTGWTNGGTIPVYVHILP